MSELPLLSCRDPHFGEGFVASLQDYGFGALVDHPIDMPRVRRIYQDWQHWFAGETDACFEVDPRNQDGYVPLELAEHAKGFDQQDFKEYFQYYPWGRCPDSLRADLAGHYDDAITFASTLLEYIQEAMPVELASSLEEPLHAMIAKSQQSMLRVLHYPPLPADVEAPRAAPHEDINFLTLLPAADGPGLEIRSRGGKWISVPNEPNQLLVNIGDMLQEVSKGWLPSTTHQVAINDDYRDTGRMSLPLFLHPRPDVRLSERYSARSYLQERLGELGVL
ncbi:MAG: 2OG-Fe(II) oxygenase family protein [Halieaceae bacterium]